MTWRTHTVEEERLKFIREAIDSRSNYTFTEICEKYNIATKTGYKWLKRFMGEQGLKDRSRARLTYPDKIAPEIESHIIALRKEYPTWGPKKIQALMVYRGLDTPSTGSIGNILKKRSLSKPRHYRKHVAQTAPLSDCQHPNDVWMYDFKGYFKTQNGEICEPLTMTDGYSRYLLKCVHMKRKTGIAVWDIVREAFLEYGLPLKMRSDNGPPFATTGLGRLSRLAVNLIKAGVTPEWIEPGCPEQNGRHERFHLTLKEEIGSPAALTLPLQLAKMDQFIKYYNEERPHEALGQVAPKNVYKESIRRWDGKLRPPEYSSEYEVRKVELGGKITWKGGRFFISEVLQGEYVGLKEMKVGLMGVYYGPIMLAEIDLDSGLKRPKI